MAKKMLSSLLCTCLAVSMLVGCGNTQTESSKSSEKESDETKSQVEESVQESEEEECVTVKLCLPFDPQDDEDMVLEALNELLEERYNVRVDLESIAYGEYNTRMQLIASSQEDWDLAFTCNWGLFSFAPQVSAQAFLSLNDVLETEAGKQLKEVIPDVYWGGVTVDGEIYAVPNTGNAANQMSYYIQKDYADKYNLNVDHFESPWDIEPFLQQIVDNETDVYPVAEGMTSVLGVRGGDWCNEIFSERWAGLVVDVDDDTYKVKTIMESDEVMTALKKQNEWYQKGYMRLEPSMDENADKLANRYVVEVGTRVPGYENSLSGLRGKEYIQIPIGTKGLIFYNVGLTSAIAVNANSKNPEAAIKLLLAMHTDKEIFNMLYYGLEGTHYTKDGENRAYISEGSGYADRYINAWMMGNELNRYLVNDEDEECISVAYEMMDKAASSQLGGFSLDTTAFETEWALSLAIIVEYNDAFKNVKMEDADAFIEKVYTEMCEDGMFLEIRDEVQRQIDEWRAANNK